jgi:ligand-binding sensor domain-containing protein
VFLHFSCIDKNTTVGQSHKIGLDSSAKSHTLKFTSVIRAIFQDSKGKYWFGSSQEGVAMYNGTSFTYFTSKEGLSSNQINSIQEDTKGIIWFETPSGVSSYDGVRITNHTTTSKEISLNVFPIQRNTSTTNEWKKTANDLWFAAGNTSGVYRYDGLQLEYLELPPQKVLDPNDNLFAVTGIQKAKTL